ncbi:MAG TPA: response regulator, partial [Actinomycetota bacterium]|nr:response regulator [Actinomycetota bacterium]
MRERDPAIIAANDEALIASVSRILTRAGFSTTDVRSGEGALKLAEEDPPGLIVLDSVLPDMSGLETCYELRQRIGDRVPILCLSEEAAGPRIRVATLLIGADDVVSKPFDHDELLARVRKIVSRRAKAGPTADIPLTGREVEVLELLASGVAQDAIAEMLFISSKTVGTHLQRIISKL